MAKKSAKSKGYRKSIEKKPYLTRRDILMLCALIAVVAVGAILLFTYDDGALKVMDGKIVEPGDNWVIVNGAARGGKRYYKLAEAGEIEGYTRETTPGLQDENLPHIKYTPTAEDSKVKSISLSANAADARRVAEYYQSLASTLGAESVEKAMAGDVEYQYFTYTASGNDQTPAQASIEQTSGDQTTGDQTAAETTDAAAETEGETSAPERHEQYMHAYVDAPRKCSIGINITVEADSEADFMTEEELEALVAQAVDALTMETK